MLTTDRETAICEKYSAYDKNNRVYYNDYSLCTGSHVEQDPL